MASVYVDTNPRIKKLSFQKAVQLRGNNSCHYFSVQAALNHRLVYICEAFLKYMT